MTQISLNNLKQYVNGTVGRQPDTAVIQLDRQQGTFQISTSDKRYALFRSGEDKGRNNATRAAVCDALKNAGLDLNNLSDEMKKAMKITDFELKNGVVTSTKPLSDRRLRCIVAQAEREIAKLESKANSMRECSNAFEEAFNVISEGKTSKAFMDDIKGMKATFDDFVGNKIGQDKFLSKMTDLKASAQNLLKTGDDNTLKKDFTYIKEGFNDKIRVKKNDNGPARITGEFEVISSYFDKDAYEDASADIVSMHNTVLNDILKTIENAFNVKIPDKKEPESPSVTYTSKEAVNEIIAVAVSRATPKEFSVAAKLVEPFTNILEKTPPEQAPAALKKQLAAVLKKGYDNMSITMQSVVNNICNEVDNVYPEAEMKKQLETYQKLSTMVRNIKDFTEGTDITKGHYISKPCVDLLEKIKNTVQEASQKSPDGNLSCDKELATQFSDLKNMIENKEHVAYSKDHKFFAPGTRRNYDMYVNECNKKITPIMNKLSKSIETLFPGAKALIDAGVGKAGNVDDKAFEDGLTNLRFS